MTAAQKIGGFRPPTATESAPVMSTSLAMPDASSSALQSNNPYREASPSQGPASSSLSQPGLGDDFPSYDPPSYELATSTSSTPLAVDSKREQVPQSYEAQYSYETPQSSQPPQPRQSPTSSQTPQSPQQSSGFMDQAMARLNQRDPLDPPPPCFSRIILPPSATITYEPLPHPLIINAKPDKRFLDEAFVTTGTPALYRHDILAEDWVRLLEDIQITARLTGGQKVVAGVLPMTMHIGFTGFFVSRAIERGMKRKNVANVVKLLNIWNERFFKPRRLEITLCHGDWRASSEGDKVLLPAPDRPNVHARQRRDSDSSSSSSSSSESEDETPRRGLSRSERRQMRQERRAERRERRDERRASRDARRAEKRARRAERREQRRTKKTANYRLVVVSV